MVLNVIYVIRILRAPKKNELKLWISRKVASKSETHCEDDGTRKALMIHKKQENIEKVPICWTCLWGNSYWFYHTKNTEALEESDICGQTFKTRKNLNIWKKNDHPMSISLCTM